MTVFATGGDERLLGFFLFLTTLSFPCLSISVPVHIVEKDDLLTNVCLYKGSTLSVFQEETVSNSKTDNRNLSSLFQT